MRYICLSEVTFIVSKSLKIIVIPDLIFIDLLLMQIEFMDRNQPYIVQDKKKNHLNNQIFKILPPPRSEDKMPG